MNTSENTALDALTASVDTMTRADACAVLPAIASLHAQIEIIAFSPDREVAPDDDALLTVAEAAEMLSMSESYIYDHWAALGGRKFGAATRFTRAGLLKSAAGTRQNDDDTLRDRTDRARIGVPRRRATAHRGS